MLRTEDGGEVLAQSVSVGLTKFWWWLSSPALALPCPACSQHSPPTQSQPTSSPHLALRNLLLLLLPGKTKYGEVSLDEPIIDINTLLNIINQTQSLSGFLDWKITRINGFQYLLYIIYRYFVIWPRTFHQKHPQTQSVCISWCWCRLCQDQ